FGLLNPMLGVREALEALALDREAVNADDGLKDGAFFTLALFDSGHGGVDLLISQQRLWPPKFWGQFGDTWGQKMPPKANIGQQANLATSLIILRKIICQYWRL